MKESEIVEEARMGASSGVMTTAEKEEFYAKVTLLCI